MEVALGASMTGARAFCAMKHVGLNVASDCLMTMTITGAYGGLVIAVADDVGMSSSQNEQDSRFWGRFAHIPVLEPADSQEAYEMTKFAFGLSEQYETPVLLRLTTRICHVKGLVVAGEREAHEPAGFVKNPQRWVMVPAHAKARIPALFQRDETLRAVSDASPLNVLEAGSDRSVGFVASGPAYMHVKEAFPDAPVLKLGLSYPWPPEKMRELAAMCDTLVVVEETEKLLETEIRAAGIACHGKDMLPSIGELSPQVLTPPSTACWASRCRRPRPPPRRPRSSRGRRPCALPARTWACTTRCRRSRTSSSPATSAATRWAPAIRGTRWTPRSAWAPRWAWRWASTRDAARSTRTSGYWP
jgi:indolepyruvate ferredoxin oxidoreductase alpha subunit